MRPLNLKNTIHENKYRKTSLTLPIKKNTHTSLTLTKRNTSNNIQSCSNNSNCRNYHSLSYYISYVLSPTSAISHSSLKQILWIPPMFQFILMGYIKPQQSTTITRPEKLKFIHNSGLQYINEISDIKIATLGYDFILHQVLVSIFMHSVMQSGQLIQITGDIYMQIRYIFLELEPPFHGGKKGYLWLLDQALKVEAEFQININS